jgi:hypothetical protein
MPTPQPGRLRSLSPRPKCDRLKPLSYRATTELGTLASALLADLERLRPGFAATADIAQIAEQCTTRVRLRLPELYAEFQGEDGPDAESQLALYSREVEQVLIPRYAKLALAQNQIERHATRGALYNRLSYAALFFVLGLFIVWAPFIPIWEKWVPFALAVIAPLVSPWLPDLYQSLRLRQHRIHLGVLLMDLDEAGRTLPLPPLGVTALPANSATGMGHASAREGTPAVAASARKKESNGNAV